MQFLSHPFDVAALERSIELARTIVARYPFHLTGGWCHIYVISAVLALYLNVFVAVVQAFRKVPALKALAPTQKEAPFVIAQLVVLALFVALGIFATKRFRSDSVRVAARAA